MSFIKKNAALISRIVATVVVATFIMAMLLYQPRFYPSNPIYAGQTPQPEVMMTSREADDIDNDSTEEDREKDKDKKKKDKSKDKEEKDKEKDQKEDQNKPSEYEGDKDSKPGKPKEDPNSDNGNKTGIADRDDPTNQEGSGNNGRETPDPTADPTDDPIVVTDLNNYDNPRIIEFSELRDGKLKFYAYIANIQDNMDLKVKLTNDGTPGSGKYITADGRNYIADLKEGRNRITLYMRKGGIAVYHITYTIRYVPNKADEDNPAVGDHPPTITAYGTSGIDDFTKHIKIPNYIFRVQGETYKGDYLPYDNMRVEFVPEVGDRRVLNIPTGHGLYEYDMYFLPPISGDTYKAKVNVTVWDDEGNSSFKSYVLTYEEVGYDQVIGVCEVYVDMTTIGFGIEYSGFEYEVRREDKASDCVLAALDYYGLEPNYAGTPRDGFYLRGVASGLITYGAKIPSMLKDLLILDGLTPERDTSRDDLKEFDFTRGSGWMYTIDGVNYPGRGMDRFELTGNETITLRFTLAYGKDLGLRSAAGNTNLNKYCGSWYNGSYHPKHVYDPGGGEVIDADDCEEGTKIKCWHCQICGKYFMSEDHSSTPVGYENQVADNDTITLPAGEHKWKETGRVEATTEKEGYIDYKCSVCGKTKRETIPKQDPPPEDPEDEDGSGEDPPGDEGDKP